MAYLHMIYHMGCEFLLFIQYNFTKYCCSTLSRIKIMIINNKNSSCAKLSFLFFPLKENESGYIVPAFLHFHFPKRANII